MEQQKNFIIYAYKQAIGLNLAENKQDFAQKLDISPSTLSKALAGDVRYATNRLRKKIEKTFPTLLQEGAVAQEATAPQTEPPNDAYALSEKFIGLLQKKDEQMDRLLTLLEKK